MKKILLALLLSLSISWFFLDKGPAPLEQRGMSLGLFSKEKNYSYLNDLKEMKGWGVTHVMLVVSWYQKDVRGSEIRPRDYDGDDVMTIPDEKLKEVIRQAHSLGLKTMLFPILRLEVRQDKDWRGVIQPKNLELWWKSYQTFILHYAQIAAEEGTDIFSVGSELLSREKETAHWKDLIAQVRRVFPGKLLYSANWDHYLHPEFWDDLDYLGVTAYYEVSKKKTPSLGELKQSWGYIQKELLRWKQMHPDKKLVFTEIGYPSVDGTAIYPWNYYLEGQADPEEQALCYRAFIDTWRDSKDLAGVFFWVWWGEGGLKDKSYTPRGKPAEKWLKGWYKS